jgi:hypothetical protein
MQLSPRSWRVPHVENENTECNLLLELLTNDEGETRNTTPMINF